MTPGSPDAAGKSNPKIASLPRKLDPDYDFGASPILVKSFRTGTECWWPDKRAAWFGATIPIAKAQWPGKRNW